MTVTSREERLTSAQRTLMQALHTTEWRKVPNATRAPTIVSLLDRKLIEGRRIPMAMSFPFDTYARAYEWKLT